MILGDILVYSCLGTHLTSIEVAGQAKESNLDGTQGDLGCRA